MENKSHVWNHQPGDVTTPGWSCSSEISWNLEMAAWQSSRIETNKPRKTQRFGALYVYRYIYICIYIKKRFYSVNIIKQILNIYIIYRIKQTWVLDLSMLKLFRVTLPFI